MQYRVVLAFLIAPLVVPVAGLLLYAAHAGAFPPVYAARGILKYSGLIAYTVTAIFGAPAYLLLRSSRFGGKLTASLYGGIIGLAISVILFALFPGFFIRDNTEGYIVYALTGAVTGLAFWVIASGGR